jgi:hypothetical protein
MDMTLTDAIWTSVAFILTLCIFSYLFGDNFFFRLATYLFVGVSAGYVFVLVFFQVIIPRLIIPLQTYGFGELMLFVIPPLLGGTLLLTKISPRLSPLGTLPMAFLVGVGAAVAVGGAVFGTIAGQIEGTASTIMVSVVEGFIVLVGTVCTLAYFQFGSAKAGQSVRRNALVEGLAKAGQVFIGITLGALFAGVYAAALTAFMERLEFLVTTIANITF